ncbi:hypothetical protein LTR99_010960 [Exophiala xenobiotica]|uniref:RING-type domain-containing protein n=1 Tax=Vermiconidia calcicola TaxID=1690605 RepID=A0AAV9QDY5_9PEZI|nr:hypothetical protein LTR99_010960 [Exophiala xenobiotica]KAK5541362.1 hypothetical protein LTR25_003139 [Vermiconidia calcicola]
MEGESNMKLINVVAHVHLSLLFPFTHIVCVFADDLGGNLACARYLETWLELGVWTAEGNARACPQLVIVTTDTVEVNALLQTESHTKFTSFFDSLVILTSNVSKAPSDPASQFLQARLGHILDDVRDDHRSRHLLFSAQHMVQAFAGAVQQFVRGPRKAVDLFTCLAPPIDPLSNFDVILKRFFSIAAKMEVAPAVVFDFIASAMLVQAYHEQSHHFAPTRVFDVFFYRDFGSGQTPPCYDDVLAIRTRFLDRFKSLGPRISAIVARQKLLRQQRPQWRTLKSTTDCFLCMARPSERMLLCGHSLCEECIRNYYPPDIGPYTYCVGICEFCGIDALSVFSCKPVTVEPNIAAIDGGGVRGVVALVLLKRLQAALDTGQPVWEYFDSFIGTSVGGLIVLDHVVCGSSVDASIERLAIMSRRIFPSKSYGFMALFRHLLDWLAWWFSDNKYDSGVLDDVVQDAFGVHQRLFDSRSQHAAGVKVAVTATTVSTSQLRLFTNYNGLARSKQGKELLGYAILRPLQPSAEPYLWEMSVIWREPTEILLTHCADEAH